MAENLHEEHIQHAEITYERSDLSTHGVLLFLVGLAVAGVLIHIVLWGMYAYLDKFQQSRQPLPNPLAEAHSQVPSTAQTAQKFPQPRLQPDPVADLNNFRAREEQVLNSYGWVDKNAGVAHIPIEQAIEILAARGLPVRETGMPTAAGSAAPRRGGPANQTQKSSTTSK